MFVRQELELKPAWRSVEWVREAAARAVQAALRDDERADAVAMVSAELLENAIKHTSVHDQPLRYGLMADRGGFTVQVSNGCSQRDWRNVDELRTTIEWIARCGNPRRAYLLRACEIYDAEPTRVGTLGLVRIAYGGPCSLSYQFQPDRGRVAVRADSLPPPPPSDPSLDLPRSL